jgi:hypothetical protein
LANAEILAIINDKKRSGRVNENFFDPSSQTNILVYDDVEWVSWMDDKAKAARRSLFAQFNLLGSCNWATDLEKFHDPPNNVGSWDQYRRAIKDGDDPTNLGPITGNWTHIDCTSPFVEDLRSYSPAQRWTGLGCDDAFNDVVETWKIYDRPTGNASFTGSASMKLRGPEITDCREFDHCKPLTCGVFQGKGTGAAAYTVWNTFALLNQV